MESNGVFSTRSAAIALERIDGTAFEKYAKLLCAEIFGAAFVPLGGMHDGGADGFESKEISEIDGTVDSFFQFTIRSDHSTKIRQTIERLTKVGRTVKSLHYITSQVVPLIDRVEQDLSRELDVRITIRDREWITANINRSAVTIGAARDYLEPVLGFLFKPGAVEIIPNSDQPSIAAAVFLAQEIERRRENTELLEATTDSLILWSLEGTDPDQKIFRDKSEMVERILGAFPSAKFINGQIDSRLRILSSKGNPTGREVREYRKENKYALPHETRELIKRENEEDEFLRLEVEKILEQRAAQLATFDVVPKRASDLAIRAIQLTFEKQGLEFAIFLQGAAERQELSVADHVSQALTEQKFDDRERDAYGDLALRLLRYAFYESTETERAFFAKLSRTYSLLFSIKLEPKVVEYFRTMSSKFVLLVGTDILIQALSERYLRPDDQMVTNMLKIVRAAGSKLVLCEPVVEEVHAHIKNTDLEFKNYFMEIEPYISLTEAKNSSKILIRTYFYGKLSPIPGIASPTGWRSFVEQICTYSNLHSTIGRDDIRRYLSSRFDMEYLDNDDMENLCNEDEVIALSSQIEEIKKTSAAENRKQATKVDVLARNDATMALAVYEKRRELKEEHQANPLGYRVWWLTYENKIQAAIRLLEGNKRSRCIMRPAFLMGYISNSPKLEEVRKTYGSIFPSLIGLQLSNRVKPELLQDMMKKYKEIVALDKDRAAVKIGKMANALKSDFSRQYEVDPATAFLNDRNEG